MLTHPNQLALGLLPVFVRVRIGCDDYYKTKVPLPQA